MNRRPSISRAYALTASKCRLSPVPARRFMPSLAFYFQYLAVQSRAVRVQVRHVVSPMLSVLLPLWLIQLLLPFVWLMELEPPNEAFSYLVTLLLTCTSHRVTMETK